MRIRFTVGVVALVAVAAVAPTGEPAKRPTDPAIFKMLIGKWNVERSEKGTDLSATDTFKKDGTFSGEGAIKGGGRMLTLTVTGTWKVEKGVLIETIETCNPTLIPKGTTSRDEIVSITDKELRIKSENGKESVKKRVAD